MKNNIIKSIIPTVFAIMVLAIIGNSISNTVLAQSNSNDTSGNQTRAEITGGPETTIINKTTVEGINQTGTQQQGGQEQQQQQQGGQEQQQQQQGGQGQQQQGNQTGTQ